MRTVFMRSDLKDWERAERIAVHCSREQILRFSPVTRAILEVESRRDLEVLETAYRGAVLLGEEGDQGWGLRYELEFHMTGDSKLFPPRPDWEAKGYRPDEYSRWLLGAWQPVAKLWAELGVDPSLSAPASVELDDWLFDAEAGPDRRIAERRFVHGHLLAPGDVLVGVAADRRREARPPYDTLPIPRADIPAGIVLSREMDAWIREADVRDIALPLYEGRMIGQFDSSQKGWVSGKGRGAVWRKIPWEQKQVEPQFLMAEADYRQGVPEPDAPKLAHMSVTSATNERTAIGTCVQGVPAGHKAPVITTGVSPSTACHWLAAILNSLAFDFVSRHRVAGLMLDYHVLEQHPVPQPAPLLGVLAHFSDGLMLTAPRDAPNLLALRSQAPVGPGADQLRTHPSADQPPLPHSPDRNLLTDRTVSVTPPSPRLPLPAPVVRTAALTRHERTRRRAILDAVVAALYGLTDANLRHILADVDHPTHRLKGKASADLPRKGFWRSERNDPPELRHTVLTLVAFADLDRHIEAAGGHLQAGIDLFLRQNQGEGWLVPETLRLADHGLGHDDRAREHQPVASALGPRFHAWQLAQPPEEAQAELHLHARNLLGDHAYRRLLADLERNRAEPHSEETDQPASFVAETRADLDRSREAADKDGNAAPAQRRPDQSDLFD